MTNNARLLSWAISGLLDEARRNEEKKKKILCVWSWYTLRCGDKIVGPQHINHTE